MKRHSFKTLLTSIVVLAILISSVLSGLVMPAAAADAVTVESANFEVPVIWLMTGRYRDMSATVTYSDDSTERFSLTSDMNWTIADTSIATVDANGRITPVKVGQTTLTGTFPSHVKNSSGNLITKTINLHVIDGSEYVYFKPEYEVGETNVVKNGDFETGFTEKNSGSSVIGADWTKYNNAIAPAGTTAVQAAAIDFDATAGKNGGYGLKLLSGIAWESNTIASANVTPGLGTYILSFDYKAAPNNTFSIYGGHLNIPSTDFTLKSTASGEWKTYTKIFRAPIIASGARKFYFTPKVINANDPVVIDNVSIREYKSLVEVDEFLLNYEAKTLTIGQTQRLEALTEPFGGNINGIVWSSSDSTVATVTAANGKNPSDDPRIMYGLVTAVGEGTATITATLPDGTTDSCEVTVLAARGGSVIADPSMDSMNKSAWTTADGKPVKFAANGGESGSAALVVDRYQPVSHSFIGLKPNTTYTLQGNMKTTPISGYVVITLVNGEQTITTVSEKYTAWGNTENGESQLAAGIKFTTPAALESDITTLHIGVLVSENDKAPTMTEAVVATARAAFAGGVEMGEGEVTDDEEDITACSAYVDYLDIFQESVQGVDLTPTYVQWKGDSNNDGQVVPGTNITFEVPVKNAGTNDLPAGNAFEIQIAANGKVIRTFSYNGGIAAGETVVATDTAAWTATAGDYMISARVNSDYAVLETNPNTNQTYQLNLRVANDTYAPAYNNDIITQAGMDRLTMSDDFNDLSSVDIYGSGAEGYKWYITRPWSAERLTPYDYKTENGVLTLHAEVPTYGIAFNSVDVATNNGYRYKYGYLEVRLRIVRPVDNDGHESGVPTVWSFTEDKALENITGTDKNWVELDWLEYWGNTNQYPGGYYTTTFHQSTTVDATPSYSNSNHSLEGLGDAEWHVMGWLWEHNKVRTFLDGKEMMNMFIDADAPLVPGARVNKKDANGNNIGSSNDIGLFSWANMEEAVLYLGGSKDNPHEIDYVRIWQTGEPETVSDNMTMDKTAITMGEKTREFLNVSVPQGEDAGTLTWKSSDPTVATVHGNGEVYARGQGKAIITATNANGVSVMSVVTVTHNLWVGGDCEETNDLLHNSWENLVGSSGYEIVDMGDGNHAYKMPYNSSTVKYYHNWSVKKNTTYVLSGRYKGPSTMYAFFNSAYVVKSGDIALGGSDTDGDGWKEFSLEFTTTGNSQNSHYTIGFRNKYGSSSYSRKDVYMDDFVLVEKVNVAQSAYTLSVDALEGGSISMKANGSALASGASVAPGTLIDVTVTPNSGNQLKMGSLEYTYTTPTAQPGTVFADGKHAYTREILNKNSTTFGADTNNTFRFVMPDGNTTLSALFESKTAADQTPIATLGTSVYFKQSDSISGVRFLNRLYYSRLDGDDLYVMYNGAEHKVTQFGSLLKRSTNEGELTLEAYNEHNNDSGATRIWKHTAYAGQNINVLDYTNQYMDFSITMTSSIANRYAFLNRGYTICAYMVLDDGTVVYSDAFTDSVLNAYTRFVYTEA